MVSKRLTAVWTALAFALLAAAAISITFSFVWRMPNLLLNFVIEQSFLTSGLALGIAYAVTFAVAVFAILQPNHITMGLAILNWVLILDAIGTVSIGSFIWFWTLRERSEWDVKFFASSVDIQQGIQDTFQCCGYFFGNETVSFQGFCANETFAFNQTGCVTDLDGFGDFTLNNIFSSIYGYTAIIAAFFLATMCVIHKRIETERFRKIDAKRGGRGFV